MASFQKRKDKWQYTISRVINGKPKPIRKSGFSTKKEAMIAAAEVEASLAKGLTPIQKKIPFTEYFKAWIELYKQPKVSSTTLKHYQYSLKAIEEYFFDTPIQNIKRMDYQQFLNDFGANRAKETVAKVNGHLKSCVLDAIEEQLIQFDFTRKTEVTWTVQAKKAKDKHLNYIESTRLLKSICKKINNNEGLGYYLLLLGLTSGLRFGEIVGLTINDFDFKENTIDVNKTWGYKRSSPVGFGPTKNEQSVRVIKIDKLTMNYFKKLIKTIPYNTNQLVFFSPSSKYKVISNTNANKLLRKLLIDLEIDPITFHGLRHTHASVLLYKKASVPYVSERLGHSDIDTTLKEYTHVLNELRVQDEKITVDVFENMFVI